MINCFFLQGNEWSRSYREINQHPGLPWNFITHGFLDPSAFCDIWESAKVSRKRVFALLRGEKPRLNVAKVMQEPVFALPGCQQISVNTGLCDALGLAEHFVMHLVHLDV